MHCRVIATQALLSVASASWGFHPQTGGIASTGLSNYPTPYNLSTTQSNAMVSSSNGSFWMSAFIHGSDGHDYLVISHVIGGFPISPMESSLYRASILDITNPSLYSQYTFGSNISTIYSSSGVFNATFDNYGFGSTSDTDGITELRTYSNVPGTQFNITFEMSSPAILNGGLGMFQISGGIGLQWSMPAGTTKGWVGVNGTQVTIDPTQSLTWFDRQWGAVPTNFTWFEVHLPGQDTDGSDDSIFSIWTWQDNVNGAKSFATTRTGVAAQQQVVPITLAASNRTFTSAATGVVYPLDYTISVAGGPVLQLSSIRDDQEIHGAGVFFCSYTGFLNVTATYPDGTQAPGFAAIESIQL